MPAYMSTVSAPASYATAPDVALEFEPDQIVITSDSGEFLFSFDGTNDHGKVVAGGYCGPLMTKRTKIWFKQVGGAATARVMALTVS